MFGWVCFVVCCVGVVVVCCVCVCGYLRVIESLGLLVFECFYCVVCVGVFGLFDGG